MNAQVRCGSIAVCACLVATGAGCARAQAAEAAPRIHVPCSSAGPVLPRHIAFAFDQAGFAAKRRERERMLELARAECAEGVAAATMFLCAPTRATSAGENSRVAEVDAVKRGR